MKYLHTMVRARDLDETLDFYCDKLGLVQVNRYRQRGGSFLPGIPGGSGRCRSAQRKAAARCGNHLELGP